MGAVSVEVVEVVDNESVELSSVPDEGAIEPLSSRGPDPALREAVGHRGPYGAREDLEAFGGEDLVEGGDEWLPVACERAGTGEQVGVAQAPLGLVVIPPRSTVRVECRRRTARSSRAA